METKPRDIKRFKKLYKDRFDIELSDRQAKGKLSLLLMQLQEVYSLITQEQAQGIVTKNENGKSNVQKSNSI